MREGNPEINFRDDLSAVRIGNWIRTDDLSYVHLSAITEICLFYQGPEVAKEETDDYEVTILTKMTDWWMPSDKERKNALAHGNHYNQMSDQQRRDIFRGTKKECEQVIRIIMLPEV